MKSPLASLLFVTVVVGIGLWVGVKWFLGGTDDFSDNIDIRSVAYTPPAAGSSANTASEAKPSAPLPPAAFGAPEAMKTVEELSETLDAVKPESEQEDEQSEEEKEEDVADSAAEVDEAVDEVEPDDEADTEELAEEQAGDAANASDDEQSESGVLSAEELDVRERARKLRLAELGLIPEKRPEPTIAVDVSLVMPEQCSGARIARVPLGLKFRYESPMVTGDSLNALESLVALYRDCEQGEFVLAENPLGQVDATDTLTQMRFDEVKYFFLQHSVSIDAVRFPEEK